MTLGKKEPRDDPTHYWHEQNNGVNGAWGFCGVQTIVDSPRGHHLACFREIRIHGVVSPILCLILIHYRPLLRLLSWLMIVTRHTHTHGWA